MAYVLIENFSRGVSRTRPRVVGAQGTMWSGINGHLSRGGDFEKRKAFVPTDSLPAFTVGLARSAQSLVTFGHEASASVPFGIQYQRLQHPTSPSTPLSKLLSWDLFSGKVYAIAKFADQSVFHYYDGAIVTDWNAAAPPNPLQKGLIARTHRRKLYSAYDGIVWFSQVEDASVFDTGAAGSGFNNVSAHQSGSDRVTGLVAYQNLLAIMSRRVVQIWSMTDDPTLNIPVQFIGESGTRSPRSVIQFGELDAFYLSDSGVRSLRARSGTNTAGVNDVGTPIDPFVQSLLASLTDEQIEDAFALIEPTEGRLWMAIGSTVLIYSYFPSEKVGGWTWYELPFAPSDGVSLNGRIYLRAGSQIYLYGGPVGNSYDSTVATLAMPFINAGKPADNKQWLGVDMSAVGTWDFRLLTNPRDEAEVMHLGTMDGITWDLQNIGGMGHFTHVAPLLQSQGDGPASISSLALHYHGADRES
jgi:hypothetical protein